MEAIKLGSLYFGWTSVKVGSKWDEKPIMIGNTDPVHPLTWVKVDNLLVADHTICTNISWENLNQAGFIFGQPVRIDGIPYLCRSLKVGNQKGVPNEWDAILAQTGEDVNLWHWRKVFFWGQETAKGYVTHRSVRGFTSACFWNYSSTSNRNANLGFRPVLESLPSELLISDSLIGNFIKVYGPGGVVISGELIDVSEYDLVLKSKEQVSEMWCSPLQDGVVAVDRSAILYTSLA